MSDKQNMLLEVNLKQLRLPTMKAEYDKLGACPSNPFKEATFHSFVTLIVGYQAEMFFTTLTLEFFSENQPHMLWDSNVHHFFRLQ